MTGLFSIVAFKTLAFQKVV